MIVLLPAVFDSAPVPFAGRLFGLTQGELLSQPRDVKPRSAVQSMDESEEAQEETPETWIRLLKKESWEGSVEGKIL